MEEMTRSTYWTLFEHMSQEHGLTLLDSQLADICHTVDVMRAEWKANEQFNTMSETKEHTTPCCNYKSGTANYPVYYNPYNFVVQCHNCGHVYSPAPPVYDDLASIDLALKNQDDIFVQWAEPWPAADSKHELINADVVQCASVRHVIAMQRLQSILGPSERDLLLDFISIHWGRFVPPPSKALPLAIPESTDTHRP
jgi:hypothetical protein